jgi:hypothetical protein
VGEIMMNLKDKVVQEITETINYRSSHVKPSDRKISEVMAFIVSQNQSLSTGIELWSMVQQVFKVNEAHRQSKFFGLFSIKAPENLLILDYENSSPSEEELKVITTRVSKIVTFYLSETKAKIRDEILSSTLKELFRKKVTNGFYSVSDFVRILNRNVVIATHDSKKLEIVAKLSGLKTGLDGSNKLSHSFS